MYFVGFSTATVVASLILFQGFNTTDATNTVSLLSGFAVTFLGVHLLNLSRIPEPPLDQNGHHSTLEGGLMNPRLSLQGRVSLDGWHGMATDGRGDGTPRTAGHGRRGSLYRAQSSTLFNAFDVEDDRGIESVGLHRLREEDEVEDDDDADERTRLRSVSEVQRRDAHRGHSHSPINPSLGDIRISPPV